MSPDLQARKKLGGKVNSVAQSFQTPNLNLTYDSHKKMRTMVANRSQTLINGNENSSKKAGDSKLVEESSELQNLNLNLFQHIPSRNDNKVQTIKSIGKANNSLVEHDTASELIGAVRSAKPLYTPEGLKQSNIKIEDGEPSTNEYYIMSEDISLAKINTEKQQKPVLLPSHSQTSIVLLAKG